MKAFLFGSLRLEDEAGQRLSLPPTADGRTLLAYLLHEADQPHGRTFLATLLNPDLSEEKARRALTQALWQVRRLLPPHTIQAHGDAILLDSHALGRDVAEFDARLEPVESHAEQMANLATAVRLYTADLLADFYDDWTHLPREQRRERFLHALEQLTQWEKQHGHLAAALDYALQLTHADPLRETAQQEVMRLYAALGRPQAAQQHYQQYHHYLEQELGIHPTAATQQLALALATPPPTAQAPYLPPAIAAVPYALQQTGQMPLIGREQERHQLVEQLLWLQMGQGGVIFVSGPPGIGKSRLLEEFGRDAAWRGLSVAWGYGRELVAVPPYALFIEAVGHLLTPLRWQQLAALVDGRWLELAAHLFPHAPTPPPPQQLAQHQLLEAISRLLLGLSQLQPVLLIFDDVQWADTASLEALLYLSHRLRHHPILVVVAFRSAEARAEAAVWESLTLLDGTGLRLRLLLEPLLPEATAEFIQRGLGLSRHAPLFSQRLYTETEGNPLLLLESLRTLHDEGLLTQDEAGKWHTPYDTATADYAELGIGQHSPTAQALMHRRLRQLPPAAHDLLQLAAVIGREVQFGWLLSASPHPQPQTLATLSLLTQRQFLRETAEAYQFSHDKVRESIYHDMPAEVRRQYHQQIAAVIATQQPTAVDLLAYHTQHGEQWAEAIAYTVQAADQARALYALSHALHQYALALHLLETHAPLPAEQAHHMRYHILLARQPLLYLTGQGEVQAVELEHLRQLAPQLPDPAQRVAILLKEADWAGTVQAAHQTAVALAEQALALAQQHLLPAHEAEAWQIIGAARYLQGSYQESMVALQQAASLWEGCGEQPDSLFEVYLQLVQNERMNGRWAEGLALAQKLLALAEAAHNEMAQAKAHTALAGFHIEQGNYTAGQAGYEHALALFRRLGARLKEASVIANLGYSFWALRDYGRAITLKEEALAIFEEMGHQKSILLSYLNLAGLYFEVGQLAKGEATTAEGIQLAQQLQLLNYELPLRIVRAQAWLNWGDTAEGEAILAAIAPQIAAEEELHTQATFWAAWGVAEVGHGRWEAAREAFTRAADLFAQEGYTDFVTAMHSFVALCRGQMGEVAGGVALSTAAVNQLAQSPGGEFVVEMFDHHAQLLQMAGERVAARGALEKGLAAVAQQANSLPLDWQAQFWQRPLHQQLKGAWAAVAPQQVVVALPNHAAPPAMVAVTWTVFDPLLDVGGDKKGRRQGQLARLAAEAAAQGARAGAGDYAAVLDVSLATVKRDLAEMRA
ncbi:MAG: AAA family ATPase [Chloroflexi bacterium]|nr:AAA family ATPase [Chloroflexota bacterium]